MPAPHLSGEFSKSDPLAVLKVFAAKMQQQQDLHELGEVGMPFCTMFLDEWADISIPFLKQKGEIPQLLRDINDALRNNQMGTTGPGIFHATPENPLWQRIQSFIQDAPPAPVEEKAEIRPAREAPAAHASLTL
ncbi:MAG: hypothetical protein IPO54_10675 [Micavibrio sp.]|nr:hypothetical protein [Micavibrio sp.]